MHFKVFFFVHIIIKSIVNSNRNVQYHLQIRIHLIRYFFEVEGLIAIKHTHSLLNVRTFIIANFAFSHFKLRLSEQFRSTSNPTHLNCLNRQNYNRLLLCFNKHIPIAFFSCCNDQPQASTTQTKLSINSMYKLRCKIWTKFNLSNDVVNSSLRLYRSSTVFFNIQFGFFFLGLIDSSGNCWINIYMLSPKEHKQTSISNKSSALDANNQSHSVTHMTNVLNAVPARI